MKTREEVQKAYQQSLKARRDARESCAQAKDESEASGFLLASFIALGMIEAFRWILDGQGSFADAIQQEATELALKATQPLEDIRRDFDKRRVD